MTENGVKELSEDLTHFQFMWKFLHCLWTKVKLRLNGRSSKTRIQFSEIIDETVHFHDYFKSIEQSVSTLSEHEAQRTE